MKTVIYVVRHGESEANRDEIISGHFDTPLTDEGRKQAAQTAIKLKDIHFDGAYSSDLQRAIETAEIIYGKSLDTANHIEQLRERTFGSLEGKPSERLRKLFEDQRDHRNSLSEQDRWEHQVAEDIESDHMLSNRFTEALEQIAQDNPGKTILVAAHGGGIRTMLIKLKHGTPAELPSGSFRNAGHVKLVYDGKELLVDEVDGVELQKRSAE